MNILKRPLFQIPRALPHHLQLRIRRASTISLQEALHKTPIPSIKLKPNDFHHSFRDKSLENSVFFRTSINSGHPVRFQILEYIGDRQGKGPTALLVYKLYPHLNEAQLSLMNELLTSNLFYAHLADVYGLSKHLGSAGTQKAKADLLEAFFGAVFLDMRDVERFFRWLEDLLRPYAEEIYKLVIAARYGPAISVPKPAKGDSAAL